jgi:hypothetical protein
MRNFLCRFSYSSIILGCFTLGLAPFAPPHFIEKLQMLFSGILIQPLDIGDLMMHGVPWTLLLSKLVSDHFHVHEESDIER